MRAASRPKDTAVRRMKSCPHSWRRRQLLIGVLIATSAWALAPATRAQDSANRETCTVSDEQTVVRWKSTYRVRCELSIAAYCVWPLPYSHVTYKVTAGDSVPLRNRSGKVIAAVRGQRRRWLTYDAAAWNALERSSRGPRYIDFEPINTSEYVVMVETRYRLFEDVESTLGVCVEESAARAPRP